MCHTEVTLGILTAPGASPPPLVSEPSRTGLTLTLEATAAAGFLLGGKMLKPLRSTLGVECVVASNYLGD
jgi:hypothetical protein